MAIKYRVKEKKYKEPVNGKFEYRMSRNITMAIFVFSTNDNSLTYPKQRTFLADLTIMLILFVYQCTKLRES